MRMTVKNLQKINRVTAIECMNVLKSTSGELHDKYPELFRQYYNKPTGYYAKMVVLNSLLEMHGVESFEHRNAVYGYLNSGDPYSLTVIYNSRKGNFTLNSLEKIKSGHK